MRFACSKASVLGWTGQSNFRGSKSLLSLHHHPPALDEQAITESRTMRSLASNGIISRVGFTALSCSRRVKLWNRQASIIRDLTTLALRHEERCLRRV